MKLRRKKRVFHDWPKEISLGHTNQFYNSTEYDIWREKVLERDHYECQFFNGNYDDGKHKPEIIKLIRANTAHHKIPIKVRPDLCLDINNGVALSFEAHEIIEERTKFRYKKRISKKPITEERW